MATLTDRPDITWTYLATKLTVGKRRVSVGALVNLKAMSCQQLLYYDFVSAALCSTDDLPRKSEAHCYTERHVPGRVAQSVGHLTRKSGVLGSIPGLATYFRFSFRFFKRGSFQLLAKVCARSTG